MSIYVDGKKGKVNTRLGFMATHNPNPNPNSNSNSNPNPNLGVVTPKPF
jgi:hypothetical protein